MAESPERARQASSRWVAVAVSAAAFVLVAVAWSLGVFRGLDLLLYDARFKIRGARPAPDDIVVVAVDDRSLDLLGVETGIPTRRHWGRLVRALGTTPPGDQHVCVIAFDYWLPELTLPKPDAALLFRKLLELHSADAARQGAEPIPTDAMLFVQLGLLPEALLAGVRNDPDAAGFAEALDARGAAVAGRMREIETAHGFPNGLSPNYRRLFFAPTLEEIEADLQLAFEIRTARSEVVLARFISVEGDRVPDPLFAAVSNEGLISTVKDDDGGLRSIPAGQLKPVPGRSDADAIMVPPLSVAALAAAEGIGDLKPFGPGAHLGPHPLPPEGTLYVDFAGPARTFRHVPLYRVIPEALDPRRVAQDDAQVARGRLPPREPPLLPGALGKVIVLVGDTSQTGQDFVATPFSTSRPPLNTGVIQSSRSQLVEMAGVEFHANAVETVRRHTRIRPPGRFTVLLGLVCVAGAGLVFFSAAIGFRRAVTIFLGLAALLVVADYGLFTLRFDLHLSPLVLLLFLQFASGVTLQGLLHQMKRAQVTQLFGRYLSPKVVQRMVEGGGMAVDMTGQTKHLSTLFSDIRNFTKIAESMTAAEVAAVLQDYFGRMIGVVFAREGTLDKLMGDAVMAFFGAPEEQPDHPVRACETALDMMAALATLKLEDPRPVMQILDIGIGVNTGNVTVGNLGSAKFVNYTVLGDAVNLASRLEGLNKEYGTHIIVGPGTAPELPAGRLVLRELDSVTVKGKTKPVVIHELVGRAGAVAAPKLAAIAAFASGLSTWRAGDFKGADVHFAKALEADPTDGPSLAFRRRCAEYIADPPEGAWEGVFVPRTK